MQDDLERTAFRLWLELKRLEAREDYEAASAPFGEGRGLDLWIEYGQLTTVNRQLNRYSGTTQNTTQLYPPTPVSYSGRFR